MIYRNQKESNRALKKCNNKCIICGWNSTNLAQETLVIGCHIKEFSIDKSADNYKNIIALCPNHHLEFDNNIFYIETKSHKLVSYRLDYEYNGMQLEIDYINDEYLAYREKNNKILERKNQYY